jgi:hypothetical protein
VFNSLYDWTKSKEKGIRFYSGIAVYNKVFDLPDNSGSKNNSEFFLDLGTVKNLAKVKLNGRDLGILWTSPWQVNVTDILKRKGNRLDIEVANLWINRLIGDESFPWDGVVDGKWPDWLLNGTERKSKRYTFTTHHYYKSNDPLAESGLIGPVTMKMVNKLP